MVFLFTVEQESSFVSGLFERGVRGHFPRSEEEINSKNWESFRKHRKKWKFTYLSTVEILACFRVREKSKSIVSSKVWLEKRLKGEILISGWEEWVVWTGSERVKQETAYNNKNESGRGDKYNLHLTREGWGKKERKRTLFATIIWRDLGWEECFLLGLDFDLWKGKIAKDQIIKQVSSTLFLIILFPFELFGKKNAISRFSAFK